MSANEKTALLSSAYQNNGIISTRNGNGHFIVPISKDPEDYDQFFSPAHFSFALSLEELLPYKDDLWWQNVRRTIFCSFWLTLIVILFAACFLAFIQLDACKPLVVIDNGTSTIASVMSS